ncbi:MAG TPA: phosphate ABC transporter substrate-binding protein [Candidatus Marinimicrobia bacterium]|nr:phosphate ABC transporter substrate-binding protein [Candidatus Neomarinimicrobiota bacterium]
MRVFHLSQPFIVKMSTILVLIIYLSSLSGCKRTDSVKKSAGTDAKLHGTITLSGAFALYPMTVKWAEEFRKLHPDVRIDISAGGAGKGMADALSGTVDLGMFSREIMPAEKERDVWWIAVTKDAVLPTISARNPVINELKKQGVTQVQFRAMFIDETLRDWGELLGSVPKAPIHLYTRSDACGAAGTWAQYLGGVQEDLHGIGVYGDPGLAEAVKKDPLGIGYNNTIYIYSAGTNQKYPGLEVIPIDINANGRIDPEEDFYDSMTAMMAAIAAGRYPSPPARELYFVARGKPESPVVCEFLKWILSEGQPYVSSAGYVPLSREVISEQLEKLR